MAGASSRSPPRSGQAGIPPEVLPCRAPRHRDDKLCLMRLIIVSNRLPFSVSIKDGAPRFRRSSGGLTTGLWSYLEKGQGRRKARQFPVAGLARKHRAFLEHQQAVRQFGEEKYKATPVFLSEENVENFYHGFCNKTIWPLFHYFPSITRYEESYWAEYQAVNQAYTEALLAVLQPDDIVWVQDYQLMLLPRLIRERSPHTPIGFFHIPFPSFEIFRLMPRMWRSEISKVCSAPA